MEVKQGPRLACAVDAPGKYIPAACVRAKHMYAVLEPRGVSCSRYVTQQDIGYSVITVNLHPSLNPVTT